MTNKARHECDRHYGLEWVHYVYVECMRLEVLFAFTEDDFIPEYCARIKLTTNHMKFKAQNTHLLLPVKQALQSCEIELATAVVHGSK